MQEGTQISILIADDHPSVKYGLKSILGDLDFISTIDEASNGIEVLELVELKHYDIIIMDIMMPIFDGLETTRSLKSKNLPVKVIALSMHKEERYVLKMLESGASGYLLKNADKEEVIDAIKTVSMGGTFISKEISISVFQKVKETQNDESKKNSLHDETLREIIFLLCAEKNSKEIAEILFLSKRTVDKYRYHISFRIGAKNLAGVIKYGIDHGIYDDILLRNKFSRYFDI